MFIMSINYSSVCIMVSVQHKHCPLEEKVLIFIKEIDLYVVTCSECLGICVCTLMVVYICN